MIEYKIGDILTDDSEALVNTVNCVGVMGRGIALQFKRRFPNNFKAYKTECARGRMKPGRVFVYDTGKMHPPRYIINFPTKRHWRGKSRMADIESGLASLVDAIRSHQIHSIAIPPLGSGLGGLVWPEVRARMKSVLGELDDVKVIIFEPGGGPAETRINRSTDVPAMTPGRATLVRLMDTYLRGCLDPFVTLLEVHKLMYFMQEAGEQLRLRYAKGHYGPYAENLRHLLHKINGHFISGYTSGDDTPGIHLELVIGAIEDATHCTEAHPDTRRRLNKVQQLVDGFESAYGLELLATVHWVVTQEKAQALPDVVDHTYAWNDRKKQFSPRQIKIAYETLAGEGWFSNS